jgi:hypothetical protein
MCKFQLSQFSNFSILFNKNSVLNKIGTFLFNTMCKLNKKFYLRKPVSVSLMPLSKLPKNSTVMTSSLLPKI